MSYSDHRDASGVEPSKGNGPSYEGAPSGSTAPRASSKSSLVMLLLVIGSIALPVVFWQSTWFGTELSDEEMRRYLSSNEKPRETQHALVQLNKRMEAGEPNVESFYPLVADLADHERSEIRKMAAWVMGGDPKSEPFHDALRTLLVDSVPLVRRNAALALSKFDDAACRDELLSMLQPFEVTSPSGGTITRMIKTGLPVQPEMELATLQRTNAPPRPVPSPLGGKVLKVAVTDGDTVAEGDVLCTLGPAEADMWEALRALVLVGKPSDVPVIREVAERAPSDRVAQQAAATLSILEARQGQ